MHTHSSLSCLHIVRPLLLFSRRPAIWGNLVEWITSSNVLWVKLTRINHIRGKYVVSTSWSSDCIRAYWKWLFGVARALPEIPFGWPFARLCMLRANKGSNHQWKLARSLSWARTSCIWRRLSTRSSTTTVKQLPSTFTFRTIPTRASRRSKFRVRKKSFRVIEIDCSNTNVFSCQTRELLR